MSLKKLQKHGCQHMIGLKSTFSCALRRRLQSKWLKTFLLAINCDLLLVIYCVHMSMDGWHSSCLSMACFVCISWSPTCTVVSHLFDLTVVSWHFYSFATLKICRCFNFCPISPYFLPIYFILFAVVLHNMMLRGVKGHHFDSFNWKESRTEKQGICIGNPNFQNLGRGSLVLCHELQMNLGRCNKIYTEEFVDMTF